MSPFFSCGLLLLCALSVNAQVCMLYPPQRGAALTTVILNTVGAPECAVVKTANSVCGSGLTGHSPTVELFANAPDKARPQVAFQKNVDKFSNGGSFALSFAPVANPSEGDFSSVGITTADSATPALSLYTSAFDLTSKHTTNHGVLRIIYSTPQDGDYVQCADVIVTDYANLGKTQSGSGVAAGLGIMFAFALVVLIVLVYLYFQARNGSSFSSTTGEL